jgi:hypothetical protein
VGVFPEDEEIFLGGERRPDAGSIGIRALRRGATFVFLTPLRKRGRLSIHSTKLAWSTFRSPGVRTPYKG